MDRNEGVINCENVSKCHIFLETESLWETYSSVAVISRYLLYHPHTNIYVKLTFAMLLHFKFTNLHL